MNCYIFPFPHQNREKIQWFLKFKGQITVDKLKGISTNLRRLKIKTLLYKYFISMFPCYTFISCLQHGSIYI